MDYILRTQIHVPAPFEETFTFFADAANLGHITPSELGFSIATPRSCTRSHEVVAASTSQRRLALVLFGAFAAALLLAIAGIYGVLAGSVSERTREIGQAPIELGIALDAKALEGLPTQGMEYSFVLPLPRHSPAPYTFAELDWNPTVTRPQASIRCRTSTSTSTRSRFRSGTRLCRAIPTSRPRHGTSPPVSTFRRSTSFPAIRLHLQFR